LLPGSMLLAKSPEAPATHHLSVPPKSKLRSHIEPYLLSRESHTQPLSGMLQLRSEELLRSASECRKGSGVFSCQLFLSYELPHSSIRNVITTFEKTPSGDPAQARS
jgi:hypothetical protein